MSRGRSSSASVIAGKNASASNVNGNGRASGPAVLVFGLALLAYAGNLANGFVYDDRYLIEQNPLVQELDWWGLVSTSYWGETVDAGLYRPLSLLSFGVNRALTDSSFGFHLTNDLLHAAAAVLTLLLARSLGLSPLGSLAAGLLFALHPAQSESVNALVGRGEILAYLFAAGSLLLYRRRAHPAWVGTTFLLALLAKESAAFALPLFVFLGRDGVPERFRGLVPLVAASAVYAALRVAALGSFGIAGREIGFLDNPLASSTILERLIAAPVLFLHYLRLVVWPRVLSADYSYDQIPLPDGILDLRVLLGIASMAALGVLATRRGPLKTAAIAFALPLLGFLHLLFPLGTIFAERLLYLPMLGVALAFGTGTELMRERSLETSVSALALVLLLFGARVWTRSPNWRDNETLFRETVETSPRSARARFLLGAELLEQARFADAAKAFESGLAIYPSHFGARMSLGQAELGADAPERALSAFERALAMAPDSADARQAAFEAAIALGLRQARDSEFPDARRAFERASELEPREPAAWNYLGLVTEREGNLERARGYYERALVEEPDFVPALLNLASVLANTGALLEAEDVYRRVLALAEDSYEAYNGLGIVLARQGRRDEAAEAFESAIAIDPDLAAARENLRALEQ